MFHWRKSLAGLALTALLANLIFRPRIEGDTEALIRESFGALSCIQHGTISGCTQAGQFPLFQAGPSILMGALGLSAGAIGHIFAYFSLACFFASLVILYKTLSAPISRLGVLIFLSGFILVYSHSSFTEMAASTWILALVASCLTDQSPWLSAGCLLIAGLSKDTAAPFLFILAILASTTRNRGLRPRTVLPLLIGTAGAIVIDAAYNYFKFQSPINLKYLDPLFIVHDVGHQVSFFLGIWFSPNGGVLFFWPAFFVLFGVLAWRVPPLQRRAVTWLGVTSLLAVITLGFSKWYAPFGWIGWGPRLLLPWIPGSLLLLLSAYEAEFKELLGQIRPHRFLGIALATALGLSAFPNFRALLYRPYPGMVLISPFCRNAVIQLSPERYYSCIEHLTWPWPDSWQWLMLYYPLPRPDLLLASAIYSVIIGLAFFRTLKLSQ